jgi:adenylate kinase family enzyme
MAMTIADPTHLTTLPDRIIVSGTTGSGKTTLGGELAAIIGAPHVELDALHWEPNWTEAPTDVFRERVREATAGERWVVDGNYAAVRDIVWPRAELIVWLDYSIVRIYARLLRRTTRRIVTREELWSGNRERFRTGFMSKDSLFLWALQTHWKRRRGYPAQLAQPEHAHLLVFRARSPRETEAMKRRIAALAATAPVTG